MLRTLSLINAIFILLIIIFLSVNFVYGNKITINQKQVQQNEQNLQSLQKLILNQGSDIDLDIFQNKSFADFSEVVPFIALLENMLYKIDPEASIIIRSQDEQIFIDHFADYKISLKIGSDKTALYKALDELYNSRFITKILDFSINYPEKDISDSDGRFEFTVRLFLK